MDESVLAIERIARVIAAAGRSQREATPGMCALGLIVARFELYQVAQEALDEAKLWFGDDDLICAPAFKAESKPSAVGPVRADLAGYLLLRVRDAVERRRAISVASGRGASRIDVLALDFPAV